MAGKGQHRIVIVGAGLGGLAAACRLARDGHDVQLYERSKSLSTASGAIFVRSNAVRCFHRWELGEVLEAVMAPIQNYQTRNAFTNKILRLEQGNSANPEWSTDRQTLQTVLYDQACKAGASVHFDNEIIDISENGCHAYATCQDGTKITADLLLAADGISSRLRPKILADHDLPSLTPTRVPSTHYPAEIPGAVLASSKVTKSICIRPDSEDSIMWAGSGGYAIGKYNHARDLFNIMFSVQHNTDGEDAARKLFDQGGDVGFIRNFFTPYHPILSTMVYMIDSFPQWRLARLEPLDTWSSPERRLVLLGDSAHAMLPNLAQGFSSIIEDIDVLSLLLETRHEIADITDMWERLRIPRVKKLQDASAWNYQLYNSGKAPGDELTSEERNRHKSNGDEDAPFNTVAFNRWILDYDGTREVCCKGSSDYY
jgi:salicylate hydroxylase